MSKSALILIAGFLVLSGCTNMAPEIQPEDQGPVGCIPEFPDMDVTYDNYVKGILTRYCIDCHHPGNSPGPGDFTNYNGILSYVGDVFYYRVVQDLADMPQNNAPLPQAVRDSLYVWIKNCAPEK